MNFPDIQSIFKGTGEHVGSDAARTGGQAAMLQQRVSRLSTVTAASVAVAVVAAVIAGASYMTSKQQLAEAASSLATVVIASEDIAQGAVVTEDMVSEASVPAPYVSSGAAAGLSDVVGRRALVAVEANSQLRVSELAGETNNKSLSARLESGKKAVSIKVTAETDLACSLLRQGDKVSLFYWEENANQKVKHCVAKDIEVVALDGYVSFADLSADGVSASYSTVTVAVNSGLAQEIRALQDNEETIWMVLSAAVDTQASSKKKQ